MVVPGGRFSLVDNKGAGKQRIAERHPKLFSWSWKITFNSSLFIITDLLSRAHTHPFIQFFSFLLIHFIFHLIHIHGVPRKLLTFK